MWQEYHERLLKNWSEQCKTYSILHILCANHYTKWNRRLGIPVLIIGCITTSSVFSTVQEYSVIWTYINGFLALSVTILAGINNFLNTNERTGKHQRASFKYTNIAMDIDSTLAFERREREVTPNQFIKAKKIQILEIRENLPNIIPSVIAKHIKSLDKTLFHPTSKVNSVNNGRDIFRSEVFLYNQNDDTIFTSDKTSKKIPSITKKMKQAFNNGSDDGYVSDDNTMTTPSIATITPKNVRIQRGSGKLPVTSPQDGASGRARFTNIFGSSSIREDEQPGTSQDGNAHTPISIPIQQQSSPSKTTEENSDELGRSFSPMHKVLSTNPILP